MAFSTDPQDDSAQQLAGLVLSGPHEVAGSQSFLAASFFLTLNNNNYPQLTCLLTYLPLTFE